MERPSPNLVRFAGLYLSSLEDLHVLIACIDASDHWWDALGIARHLGIPPAAARASLDSLARGNLLDIRITGDVRYRFRPGTIALEREAKAFAAAYCRQPLQVLQLLPEAKGQRPKA